MEKILAFSGAGISKASNIPTFEELGDLREKLSRSYLKNNPDDFFNILLEFHNTIKKAEPNDAHKALADYKIPIITMNIDGLHQKAGSKKVLEIHGNMHHLVCRNCFTYYKYEYLKKSYKCKKCNCIVDPEVVLYGDGLDKMSAALKMVDDTDHLIIIGTSYYTSTAVDIFNYASYRRKKITEINVLAEKKLPQLLKKIGD